MAFVIKLIYTKPQEEVWFSQNRDAIDVNGTTTTPAMALKDFDRWNKSQPGYISSYGKLISRDSVETVYIFDTEENGIAWNLNRRNHAFQKLQDEYFSKCNISVVESIH